MIITISDLIYEAQKASNSVFGVDINKLSQKTLFDSEQNDIHRLYGYVKKINPDEKLPLDKIVNYNYSFDLSNACFNPTLRPFMHNYLIDFSWFDYKSSSFPELSHFEEVLFFIMLYFEKDPCFHTMLLGYLYLLATEKLPYEETCFHNFFLIDFSESPDTLEAINHFRLDVKNGSVKFIFKDYDASLYETFRILTSKDEFIEFLHNKHSYNKIQRANNAIASILSNL